MFPFKPYKQYVHILKPARVNCTLFHFLYHTSCFRFGYEEEYKLSCHIYYAIISTGQWSNEFKWNRICVYQKFIDALTFCFTCINYNKLQARIFSFHCFVKISHCFWKLKVTTRNYYSRQYCLELNWFLFCFSMRRHFNFIQFISIYFSIANLNRFFLYKFLINILSEIEGHYKCTIKRW